MKLMTLNTHSLEEPGYEEKLEIFVRAVAAERPDILALQEVNQRRDAPAADQMELAACGYVPCAAPLSGGAPAVRRDNHALRAAARLAGSGFPCRWIWVPAKIGYDKYDEGLALFSPHPVLEARSFYLTGIRDYGNWKTRGALAAAFDTPFGVQRACCVHMGWWQDEEEPFSSQWERLSKELAPWKGLGQPLWLMGDFNAQAGLRGQGYDLVRESGWADTYELAAAKDGGVTALGAIDGWEGAGQTGMRIDYIWAGAPAAILSSETVFDGRAYPPVSDHRGVMAVCRPFGTAGPWADITA